MGRIALRVTFGTVLYPVNTFDIRTHRSRRCRNKSFIANMMLVLLSGATAFKVFQSPESRACESGR